MYHVQLTAQRAIFQGIGDTGAEDGGDPFTFAKTVPISYKQYTTKQCTDEYTKRPRSGRAAGREAAREGYATHASIHFEYIIYFK